MKRRGCFRVAGNLSKNRIAYNRVRSTDELKESLAAEQQEDLFFVWEAVKGPSGQVPEVIHLFYYEGLSTAEIAAILEQKRIHGAFPFDARREKLRSIFKGGV